MSVFLRFSDYIIPLLILAVILCGVFHKRPVYDEFVDGAKEGLSVVAGILPTLVGLMMGVGMLRASGALEALASVLAPIASRLHFPAELVPVALVRMFSSSAATGLVLDIFKEYGPDSYIGMMTSIMMSCTETIFYTMSVYFLAAKVTRTRYTLAGALTATFAGILASVILTNHFY